MVLTNSRLKLQTQTSDFYIEEQFGLIKACNEFYYLGVNFPFFVYFWQTGENPTLKIGARPISQRTLRSQQ